MLQYRAKTEIQEDGGNTPLILSARNNHIGAVKILLSTGAKPDSTNKDLWSPLMYAASRNNLSMLKLLLKMRAHPGSKNRLGWTPLMMATQSGNVSAVSTLIRHGADVNERSSSRRSALFIAREYNKKKVAEVLKKAGAIKLQDTLPTGKREKKRKK